MATQEFAFPEIIAGVSFTVARVDMQIGFKPEIQFQRFVFYVHEPTTFHSPNSLQTARLISV